MSRRKKVKKHIVRKMLPVWQKTVLHRLKKWQEVNRVRNDYKRIPFLKFIDKASKWILGFLPSQWDKPLLACLYPICVLIPFLVCDIFALFLLICLFFSYIYYLLNILPCSFLSFIIVSPDYVNSVCWPFLANYI